MKIVVTLLCLFVYLGMDAKTISFNKEWDFQRISNHTKQGEIKNQGTDWSSQFNVVHVNSSSSSLAVSPDTLKKEFQLLQQGKWENVNLPHSAFIEDLVVLHQWQGVCYYRKTIDVPKEWLSKQVWLEFGAAMNLADIWVNGEHIKQHAGGYLPFVVNLSGLLQEGDGNEILVRLDNRDNELIPPGKPLNTLDFCYYSGLYRDVDIHVKANQHITHPIMANKVAGGGIFVTYPSVNEDEAIVRVTSDVANVDQGEVSLQVRNTLYQIDGLFGKGKVGKRIAQKTQTIKLDGDQSKSVVMEIKVGEPALWEPENPHLYQLVTEIIKDGKVVDQEDTRIGIRTIEMTKEKGFLINGKPLRLVGSNRHMEYPYVGNALSVNAQYRDIYQIRNSGFNVVRLGHYPQDPSVLDACDELGLLAIEPIPGWQYYNKDSLFVELSYRDIRDMIRRDRNHPSVIMWETTLNEAWPPNSWKDGAVHVAHEEYPGDQCYTSGDAYGYDGFDVSYNDWQEGYKRPNNTKNPGFIREYYDYEFGGHYSTTRITRAQGERALLQNAWNAQWSHNRYRKMYPQTMGDAVWSMYDYNRGCCDNICYSGVADVFRLPKYSLEFFKTQVRAGEKNANGEQPYEIFIANRWDERASNADTVLVFANVDEIELKVNGKRVARQIADRGEDTEYVKNADGGNCKNLNFPPFTFKGIAWTSGSIEAIGYVNGEAVASYRVITPEKEEVIKIEYFESGYPAQKDDLLIVYVKLLDKNGTLVPINDTEVRLKVDGGEIQGPAVYNTEAGIASFIVRTADKSKLKLSARTSSGLTNKITLKL